MATTKNAPHPDPTGLLELVIRRAPAMLAAGITHLSIDGFSVTLSPPPPPAPNVKPEPIAKSHIDPLRDPSTYPGGKVPGFTRDEDKRG
ncbi:MAG: hypothetical protein ACM358_11925 [Gemmatimonadota bacterium]